MAKKNLWGELPTEDVIRTPLQILREQAAILGEKTENLLEGQVQQSVASQTFQNTLFIVAPSLGYSYAVLSARYSVDLYPVTVIDAQIGGNGITCEDEESFEQALTTILSSAQTKKALVGLLSQIKAEV